jgi:hypothetical protein
MTVTEREKMLTKIQKMIALAKGEREGGNETAADSYMKIVSRMMIANAITMESVEDYDASGESPVKEDVRTGRQLVWIRQLWHSVAEANNCTSSYVPKTDKITIYGAPSDIEVVRYLAVYLVRSTNAAIQREAVRCKINGHHFRRNDFARSMVTTLAHRLASMRREAAKEAAAEHGDAAVSTALVRLDGALQRAKDFAATHGLGKGRSSRYSHNAAGAAAGRKVAIHKGLTRESAPAGAIA